mmetsp:Transcript_71188/g.184831  ORF Transcript_71188/g.184831 Transcript_71188/m.184831 type:complete len:203 (-) Transcript_71188:259-867(-)
MREEVVSGEVMQVLPIDADDQISRLNPDALCPTAFATSFHLDVAGRLSMDGHTQLDNTFANNDLHTARSRDAKRNILLNIHSLFGLHVFCNRLVHQDLQWPLLAMHAEVVSRHVLQVLPVDADDLMSRLNPAALRPTACVTSFHLEAAAWRLSIDGNTQLDHTFVGNELHATRSCAGMRCILHDRSPLFLALLLVYLHHEVN